MKSVFSALFADNDCALVTIVGNRVEKYSLTKTPKGLAAHEKLWSAKIKHASNLTEASQQRVVVATDTSGRHFGLSTTTGELLWRTDPIGEGDPAVILSDSSFVFVTWTGIVQHIDPGNGRELHSPFGFDMQLRQLHLTPQTDRLSVKGFVAPKPRGDVLYRLDMENLEASEILHNALSDDVNLSPDGQKVLCRYNIQGPNERIAAIRWEIRDASTGAVQCDRTLEFEKLRLDRPMWSPDGALIASANWGGHLFLSAATLATVAVIPGKFAVRLAFDSTGRNVCLCRQNNTAIVAIENLSRWAPADSAVV